MKFEFLHVNLCVSDLEKSLEFYREALDLKEIRRLDFPEFIMVYLTDNKNNLELELKYLKKPLAAENLLEKELFHIAMQVDDYDHALQKHKAMNCIAVINEKAGIYFINDPDNYKIEILPQNFFYDK
ncbi:VOC family protein [Pectinatus brassicae]|jgi:lactoylglutathione lyase|uniref:Lactoylglutathione lyase n=1 Tax=Pectinatus brassicae TaxID=862415 RepID=A0A840UK81_9FIRM|nr:VOC family protein [Pectinatus brassicae]MBB5336057.1 lactoylglutathione lyase [Pectinatus brassicae]